MIHLDAKKVLPWILFLIFFAVLNETVFSVATPLIQSQFHLTPSAVSWMMTMFIVPFGIGAVVFGRLSDLFSLRLLITLGILIYSAGSILGFVGQDHYGWILAARAIQGIGGSALPALVMVIVVRFFEPEVRGSLFGSIGSVVAVALGVGPVLGGQISQHLHWTWLFLVPLALLIALPVLRTLLPREERRSGSVDVFGALVMATGLGAWMVWLTIPEWYYLTGGTVLVAIFLLWIFRVKEPFIQPDLFGNRGFRRGVLASLCLMIAMLGLFFVLPLALTLIFHLEPDMIGLVLFPGAISGVVVGPLGGRLADRHGNRVVLFGGMGLATLGLAGTAWALGMSPWFAAATLLPAYAGFSLLQTGLVNSVSQTLPEEETGVGMGVFNLVGILAGAVGAALVGKVLEVPGATHPMVLATLAILVAAAMTWYAFGVAKPVPGQSGQPSSSHH